MPDWDGYEWLGNIFIFTATPNDRDFPYIGPVFKTENYANRIADLFSTWNYNEEEDLEGNIVISFVIEDPNTYSTYIYPSPTRKTITKAEQEFNSTLKDKSESFLQEQLLVFIIMCKQFPFGTNSNLKNFLNHYDPTTRFYLTAFFAGRPAVYHPYIPETLQGRMGISIVKTRPILKTGFKLAKRSDLTKKDIEYHHAKSLPKDFLY